MTYSVVVQDHAETREILNLTLAFNHDIVDGAPAARFTGRLTALIEKADGLQAFGSSPDVPPSP